LLLLLLLNLHLSITRNRKQKEMNTLFNQACNSSFVSKHEGTRRKILCLLSQSNIDWEAVDLLLQELPIVDNSSRCSLQDDPMGRLFLCILLSRNPPLASVQYALRAFPDAACDNAGAFFTACRDASSDVLKVLLRHNVVRNRTSCNNDKKEECPYPWILSEHISLEGAKSLIEIYPQGVLMPSTYLKGYCPLDYFLLSQDMIDQREFDMILWNKFKMMLFASDCCCPQVIISPVHAILDRIFSTSSEFFLNPKVAQHVLWLLHQLRWTDRCVFGKQGRDGSFPLYYLLRHSCITKECMVAARELVKIVLEAHPTSSCQVINGRLPLHLAIQNGWPCHDLLLAAYPDALNIVNPDTDLLPFQTAAVVASEPSYILDLTYELLRSNPTNARTKVTA